LGTDDDGWQVSAQQSVLNATGFAGSIKGICAGALGDGGLAAGGVAVRGAAAAGGVAEAR
jgi:hypothetical protein